MNTRAAPMPAKTFRLAQTNPLRDMGKIIPREAVRWTPTIVDAKECARSCPEKPYSFNPVCSKLRNAAGSDRHEAGLAILGLSYGDDAFTKVDLIIVKRNGLVDAQ